MDRTAEQSSAVGIGSNAVDRARQSLVLVDMGDVATQELHEEAHVQGGDSPISRGMGRALLAAPTDTAPRDDGRPLEQLIINL